MKKTCITRFLLVALATSGLMCNTVLLQPVVSLDNWFNHELKKDTGKPFHYLRTDTEFTHLNQLVSQFGMTFNHVTLHPVPGTDIEMGASKDLPDHPLFQGVKKALNTKNT